MDIGKQLRHLLEETGVTQRQLAEELNISPATLNGYFQNRREPSADIVVKLAKYFGTTTDYIYGLGGGQMLTRQEQAVLVCYRKMPGGKKRLLFDVMKVFISA